MVNKLLKMMKSNTAIEELILCNTGIKGYVQLWQSLLDSLFEAVNDILRSANLCPLMLNLLLNVGNYACTQWCMKMLCVKIHCI